MRLVSKTETGVLAVLSYLPFLLSSPGRVSADSNQYLYLDPGRFLARSLDLWDPQVGAGTVPHQHLGYAFPVGPWFWALDRVGVPDWIAQRLWLGTLTFLALLGARWLFRQLGAGPAGALAGALVYGLSPYQLAFTARISVLLMPWVALPWLVGLTIRATRTRGWAAPAGLALVLVLAGGINASSLLLVILGPVLWVVLELAHGRERLWGALQGAWKIGALALGVSLWWLVGLRAQAVYGLPVLQLTENVRTVAEHSSPTDVLRGMGNWFFYGRDRTGYSLDQAGDYQGRGIVVLLSYAIPALALAAAPLLRWAHRGYFGVLVVVGVVVAVGSFPYDDPSPYGSVWKAVTSDTSVGLAFRNSPRAAPLVVLGLAGLLAGFVGALPRPRVSRAGATAVAILAVAALLPVWEGGWLSSGVDRPEEVPGYWTDAGAAIDAGDHRTRVLEVPGASFAAYRWGNLVDPLTPGLTDRPYLAREVLPSGSAATANLLDALDRRMQLGIFEAGSMAPLARLLGVGTVVLRADLDQSGRFDTAPPGPVYDALQRAAGLEAPRAFGPPGGDGSDPKLPSVALFDVRDPAAIVRVLPVHDAVVLAGDGDGIVDAAAAGLLDGRGLVLQSAALDDAALARSLEARAHLVLTDTNRRRIQTWFYALRDNKGPTERTGRTAPDPTGYDFRLDPFPVVGDSGRTVVEQVGGRVEATAEGGPERPEDRGARAFDGDPVTAWRVAGPDPRGASVTLFPATSVSTDRLRLLAAPSSGASPRALTRVRLVFDGGDELDVDLAPESSAGGQLVTFPRRQVRWLRVEILGVSSLGPAEGTIPVGLAEVDLAGVRVDETVRLPTELFDRAGADLAGHSVDIVLTRLRSNAPDAGRQDEEARLDRTFALPTSVAVRISGTARTVGGATPLAIEVGGACRDDLLTLDGAPVPVSVQVSPEHPDTLSVASCSDLDLGTGRHRLVATAGRLTSLDIDRLVLSSGPDGGGAVLAPRGAAADETAARVRVRSDSGTRMRVGVETDGAPFWLVLGQSNSAGWQATAPSVEVGERTLVDGYANGWLIRPERAGRLDVLLEWGPQRWLWVAVAISLVAALASALIVLRSWRSPRPSLAAPPRLHWPQSTDPGSRGGWALGVMVAVGAGSTVVAPLWVGAVAVMAVAIALYMPRGRWVIVLLCPTALLVSRLLLRPSIAWVAVVLVGADLLLTARTVRTSPGEPPGDGFWLG